LKGGNHGYDNQEMDMKGFFVARGPAFKKSTIIDRTFFFSILFFFFKKYNQ